MNAIPNDFEANKPAYEFSEDILEFLALLIEEDLRQKEADKLNKSPPE